MLRFIQSLFNRRRRGLFRFHDGQRYRYVDPLFVSQSLAADPEYLPRHLGDARKGDREAIGICSRAASRAFGLRDFDGKRGTTLADRIEILLSFEIWVAALKKNMRSIAG